MQKKVGELSTVKNTFYASKNLSQALTKERIAHQHELLAISQKTKLSLNNEDEKQKAIEQEKMRLLSEARNDKALVASLNFTNEMKSSEKGKEMFEKQKDRRRNQQIQANSEFDKWLDTFNESMNERLTEHKESINLLVSQSDMEIERLFTSLTDVVLLEHDPDYINLIWDNVSDYKSARKDQIGGVTSKILELEKLIKSQIENSLNQLKLKLIDIGFELEPQVNIYIDQKLKENNDTLNKQNDELTKYIKDVEESERQKFEKYYTQWKGIKEKYHILKHEEAIEKFKIRLNENYFAHPPGIYEKIGLLKKEQEALFQKRIELIKKLANENIVTISKDIIEDYNERLKNITDESQHSYDILVKDMINQQDQLHTETNQLLEYLKDFLIKNDAKLKEGETFDLILNRECIPLIEKRHGEVKELLTYVITYLEYQDGRMAEYCNNIINLYIKLGTLFDNYRTEKKNNEFQFEVSLAKFADDSDDQLTKWIETLAQKTDQLSKSQSKISLNERNVDCSNCYLDINNFYYKFVEDLNELLKKLGPQIELLYKNHELKCANLFSLCEEKERDRLNEKLKLMTEEKQKKLEEEMMKKSLKESEEKAPEKKESKKVSEKKKAGKKQGGIDVPVLEVPPVPQFKTPLGYEYLVDLSRIDIAEKLLITEDEIAEIEKAKKEEEERRAQLEAETSTKKPPQKAQVAKKSVKKEDEQKREEEEKLKKEQEELERKKKEEELRKWRHKHEAPKDNDGSILLEDDLLIKKEDLGKILDESLDKMMICIKNLFDKDMEEANKKQADKFLKHKTEIEARLKSKYPDRNIIDSDILQQRSADIDAHKKKLDRHVRNVMKKLEGDQNHFDLLVSEFNNKVEGYQKLMEKYQGNLADSDGISEIQGCLRKSKEALNLVEQQMQDYQDQLNDLAENQMSFLFKLNKDFLNGCVEKAKGGNYSNEENDMYNEMINFINLKFKSIQDKRKNTTKELFEEASKKVKEPFEAFEEMYAKSNKDLVAKEGLGKQFGKPKSVLIEKVKGEMSKCGDAQRGIENLVQSLNLLIDRYSEKINEEDFQFFEKQDPSYSLQIRKQLRSILNCIHRYCIHIDALNSSTDLKRIPPMTMKEECMEIELEGEEQDDSKEDLKYLGSLSEIEEGAQTFNSVLSKIEAEVKGIAQKIYVGEFASYLQGVDKIPEYLENYIAKVRENYEKFRLSAVSKLREICIKLNTICEKIPQVVFGSLQYKYCETINSNALKIRDGYFQIEKENENIKKVLKFKLSPFLENPVLKDELSSVEKEGEERFKKVIEQINETQVNLIIEVDTRGNEFFACLINNSQALINLFEGLLIREDFINLPGDEVFQKQHKGFKELLVQKEKSETTEKSKRGMIEKYPGLPMNSLQIDYSKRKEFPKDLKNQEAGEKNTQEYDLPKTLYYEELFKQRKISLEIFKNLWNKWKNIAFDDYDKIRIDENLFNDNWLKLVNEVKLKQLKRIEEKEEKERLKVQENKDDNENEDEGENQEEQ